MRVGIKEQQGRSWGTQVVPHLDYPGLFKRGISGMGVDWLAGLLLAVSFEMEVFEIGTFAVKSLMSST